MPTLFAPNRDTALRCLNGFLPRAGRHYAANRNYDLGPEDRSNVSILSPYVRHRLITEQEIVAAVLDHHSAAAADKFIQEVVWRTYWKGWLEQRPQVWDHFLADVEKLTAALNPGLEKRLKTAVLGKTGLDCFDFWARELIETGYLHNHARMWFASIWIFTLKLPWQLGADFFMRHLVDGDAASNTLSWRWVGGLQTQGKTYLARADNIATFTKGRFNPESALAAVAPSLPQEDLPPRTALGYLPSVPPPGPHALIVTEDDLGLETWPIDWKSVTTVVLLDSAKSYAGVSDTVAEFKRGALADAGARLRSRVARDVPIQTCGATDIDAALSALPDRAPVVMYEMPIGASRATVEPLRLELEQRGHALCRLRRPWDAAFWPHATAGFFKVKDKIPTVLRSLGLPS
jgi:deoxyribodipyrimidine photo-lyase